MLQEFHQQLFVQKNATFQPAPDFTFQPTDSDMVNPNVNATSVTSRYCSLEVAWPRLCVSAYASCSPPPVSSPPLNISSSPNVFYYEL